MIVSKTALPGALVIEPARHGDHRGFFSESWSRQRMEEAGIEIDFVQDNHSLSIETCTLRGLHYQAPPCAQTKLVRCGRGSFTDVIVDARNGSPTYGQSLSIDLSFENGLQLLVPVGFLHGFITREPNTEIVYKVSDYYSAECDGAVHWDSCGIDWSCDVDPIISPKDAEAVPFDQWESPFEWSGK